MTKSKQASRNLPGAIDLEAAASERIGAFHPEPDGIGDSGETRAVITLPVLFIEPDVLEVEEFPLGQDILLERLFSGDPMIPLS